MADEFFQVVLYDAVEAHEIAFDVVEDFNRCGLGEEEEQGSAAGEDFDVALVGWEQRDEAVGQAAFSAHPRDNGGGHKRKLRNTAWLYELQLLITTPLTRRLKLSPIESLLKRIDS